MIIQHNISAMFTEKNLGINRKRQASIAERLSSGYKINRAADNAAGLAISEEMRAQIRGLNQGAKNVQDGISFCNTADGALNEVSNILNRIKELSVQAANDTYSDRDRKVIQREISSLNEEIDRISKDTEFNTYKIFSRSYQLNFTGDLFSVKIFDANNGSPTDPDSYGGVIIDNHTRVAWKDIDPGMVATDPNTGKTVFNAGKYEYTTAKGEKYIFECKDGSQPPDITTELEVKVENSGISIAGVNIGWNRVLDENGRPITSTIGNGGTYSFDYKGTKVYFDTERGDTLSKVITELQADASQTKYYSVYDGYTSGKAVDIIDKKSEMKITQSLYSKIVSNSGLDAYLKADNDGIWITDLNGNSVPNSKKTWQQLGLNEWDKGDYISDTKKYSYKFNDGNYDIDFEFTLLEETSKESVIQGINDAKIQKKDIKLNTKTEFAFTPGDGISAGTLKQANNQLTLQEEALLGRDFDVDKANFSSSKLTYDETNKKFTLTFQDTTSGNNVLEYTTTKLTDVNDIKNKANSFLQYKCVQSALSGKNGQVDTKTLADILGPGKITSGKYLQENIKIDATMTRTNANKTSGTDAGNQVGKTYPAAYMDFSDLGNTYSWQDLLGTGFNSTCKTCDNHYSVMFVYGGTSSTTSDGYGYSKSSSGNNHYFQIDLKSIVDKNGGNITGADLAKAVVKTIDEGAFDFHYTQYVADGSKLYVCDNREQTTPANKAYFSAQPFEMDQGIIDLDLEDTQGRNLKIQYQYDVGTGVSAMAEMVESPNGEYVKDSSGGYKKYVRQDFYDSAGNLKPGILSAPKRYNVKITNNVSSWQDYYDDLLKKVADKSTINLKSTDYDYIKYEADEQPNTATISNFKFTMKEKERGFWIQAGANDGQGVALKWDGFNAAKLGLYSSDVLTTDNAGKMLDHVDLAQEQISSIRSVFGAYTNRLEVMYGIDTTSSENLQAAESKLRDADIAGEMVNYAAIDILIQAGTSILVQNNRKNDNILELLR